MGIKILDITQIASSGFEEIPSKLYSQDFLAMVPNKVMADNFETAFFIPDKGRVVLYNNPNLYYNEERAMAIGHFECVNESETANALLLAAETKAKQLGAKWIIGPMNGSTWDSYRFSLTHNSPNFFLEPYHHLYYNQLWLQAGFETISTYSSSVDRQMSLFNPEKLVSNQKRMDEMGIVIRTIDLENYESEIAKVHSFCEAVFKNNFLYTPISEREFVQKYLPIKGFIDLEYVLMAEDADKNLVAIFFAVADIYSKTIPTLIIKTIARNPRRDFAGITHLMCNTIIQKAKIGGYKQIIHAFMHDNNKSTGMSDKFSGEVFRQYALYGKQIH